MGRPIVRRVCPCSGLFMATGWIHRLCAGCGHEVHVGGDVSERTPRFFCGDCERKNSEAMRRDIAGWMSGWRVVEPADLDPVEVAREETLGSGRGSGDVGAL